MSSSPIVIMNPTSGASRGPLNLELARRLSELYGDELHLTKNAQDAYDTAARAARERRPMIIAAGGDDTVRQVLQGMYGIDSDLRPGPPRDSQAPTLFGIIPTGTFNNFAAHLGYPRDAEAAWKMAHEGELRWVDLGWVDGLIFTESLGLGFDVEAWKGFQESPSVWRRLFDGATAVVRALYNYRSRPVKIWVDGEVRQVKVFSLTVANSKRFSAAFSIAPHAEPQSGQLDLCILPEQSKLRFLATLPLIFLGQHIHLLSDTIYLQASEIRIEAPRKYAVRVDGRLARSLPVRIRVLRGALPIKMG